MRFDPVVSLTAEWLHSNHHREYLGLIYDLNMFDCIKLLSTAASELSISLSISLSIHHSVLLPLSTITSFHLTMTSSSTTGGLVYVRGSRCVLFQVFTPLTTTFLLPPTPCTVLTNTAGFLVTCPHNLQT